MTATTAHSSRPTRQAVETTAPTGPVGRAVLGSLAVSIAAAVVLTLGVFAGADEHAITGSALLAFGAGWAMLAVLTSRYTSQPQRWARVPAAVLSVTGAGLLVAAPGEGAMTTAGWVWPPALLALTIWSGLELRKAMTGRARWVLLALLTGMAVAAVGGGAETVALAHDKSALGMPGKRYDVGGHRLHLTCVGSGSPTVVLVSGTAEMSASWARVVPQVASTTRVCAYDRAGQGWSDDPPHPQDAVEMAADLHGLLAAAGEQGPYLLAGHSLGGVYGMTFAAQYPADVAGLVLLDSASPQQFTALPKFPTQYAMLRRLYGLAPVVARLGVGRLVSSSMFSALPQPAAGQVRAFETSSRGLGNARDEVSRYRDAFRQAGALRTLGTKPLVVVTAAGTLRDTPGWAAAQDGLAALSSDALHTVADTTHAGLLEDVSGARESADAIEAATRSVRRS